MKITELSIGDWVATPSAEGYIIDLYTSEKAGCVARVVHDEVQMVSEWECIHLEPIPITPEILEKNGFEKVEPEWYMCEHNGIHISIIVWKNQRGRIEISYKSPFDDDNPLYIADFTANIPHIAVHHLQRVLRLAGVEKEIII